ncbi:MAG: hypothetical protein HYY01_15560 [Chloroflexi bacterium]|nr:hypothetical protein [Chloroflexota bacterium]
MDNKVRYATAAGVALLAIGMALRGLADQEGLQIVLLLPTFLIVGFVAAGAKRGFLLGFVLALLFALVNNLLVFPGNVSFDNASVAIAVLLLSFLFPALIAGGLASLDGLVGKRVFK